MAGICTCDRRIAGSPAIAVVVVMVVVVEVVVVAEVVERSELRW